MPLMYTVHNSCLCNQKKPLKILHRRDCSKTVCLAVLLLATMIKHQSIFNIDINSQNTFLLDNDVMNQI